MPRLFFAPAYYDLVDIYLDALGACHNSIFLELHLDLVFQFGIGRYFPGILPTNTEGKLGRDILVSYIWREPLFSLKGRLLPLF
jgi:hypothetical protein